MNPRTLATALLTTTIAGGAAADVVTSYYNSSSDYGFELEHMPDFDQVRDTLDADSNGDPGGMYCVPASLTNLLGYIGDHGFPSVMNAGVDWENEEDYDYVTTMIANMAALAGTSGTDGTYHDPAYDAMVYFLDARAPGRFTVTENLATNTTGPTLRSIAENDVNGAITALCYGIYDDLGEDVWGRLALQRTGGHCISFVRGYRSGSTREIEYMDPDDNSDSSTQSTFGAESYDVEAVEFVKANSLWDAWLRGDRTGSRIMRTSGGKYRMIDSVIHVRPRGGYSWDSSEQQWVVIWPGDLPDWIQRPQPIQSSALSITDFTVGPMNNTIWYINAEASNLAQSVRLSNGELGTYQLPHAASQLAFARDHALLAMGDGMLTRLHPYSNSTENAPEPFSVQVPTGVTCMEVEADGDALWLGGGQSDVLYKSSQRLDMPMTPVSMPNDWPSSIVCRGLASSPLGSVEGGESNGVALALLSGDDRIHLCKLDGEQLVTAAVIWASGPTKGIQFNDEGDLMVFGDQGMQLFRDSSNGWLEVSDHPFAGEQFAARTVMARSHTNFDALEHGGDEWLQVRDTDPVPGDIDGDGQVAIGDLLEIIAAFGEQNAESDVDGDGWVTVEDMLIVIGNWSE